MRNLKIVLAWKLRFDVDPVWVGPVSCFPIRGGDSPPLKAGVMYSASYPTDHPLPSELDGLPPNPAFWPVMTVTGCHDTPESVMTGFGVSQIHNK